MREPPQLQQDGSKARGQQKSQPEGWPLLVGGGLLRSVVDELVEALTSLLFTEVVKVVVEVLHAAPEKLFAFLVADAAVKSTVGKLGDLFATRALKPSFVANR